MKREKGYWKKVIAVIPMTFIVAYFLSGGVRTLNERTNLQDNMLDYKGTYHWITETADSQMQLLVGVLSLAFFFYTLTKIGGKKGYENASDHGVHGTSMWGEVEELKKGKAISSNNKFSLKDPLKTLKVEDGIVLGKVPNKNELVIIPPSTTVDNSNVFLIGASGSGKGQSFVYNNIINNTQKTMIITDPKGELYFGTHQIKRDQGFEVFQIDFLNLNQAKYNPLDYVKDDIDAKKVAETIAKNSAKDDKQDHWFVKAVDLFTGLIIYAKSINPNANIPQDVKRIFNKANEDENYLFEVCEEIGEEHPAYQYLKDASVAKGNERASIMSTFTKQTGIFSSKKVADITTMSDFNFHDFQKKKSILYVKIPMKANPVESLTATFFDQIITVFYDIADKQNGVLPIKTMFLLDEFANLGKINDYEGTLSTCRGLGMEMVTIVQDLAQLENKYGKEIGRTIINNHDTKLFLRTGDVETAKYFSGLAGETTARMKTSSNSQSGGIFTNNSSASKSTQEQYVKRPLITEGELMQIQKSDCYVFVSGYYPLKLEKAWQYVIYSDFLFGADRKPNYHSYREKYLQSIGQEVTPTYEEEMSIVRKPIPTIVEKTNVDNEETETTGAVEKVDEPEQEEIIITKVKKPTENREINNEKIVDEKFNMLAQEFLMNGFKMNETQNDIQEELVSEEETFILEDQVNDEPVELVESFHDIDAKQELLDIFEGTDITEELLEEEESKIEETDFLLGIASNSEKATEDFFEMFADVDTEEMNEDEALLLGRK